MKQQSKPVLDEQTFSKLLEAAYVLQEHNRRMRTTNLHMDLKGTLEAEDNHNVARDPNPVRQVSEPIPPTNYALTLARIVETQQNIQLRHLGLEQALQLVAERVVEIAGADGASIGILEEERVRYCAVSGKRTPTFGSIVSLEKSLSATCLKTGQVFGSGDSTLKFVLETEECRKRGIRSLIALPIFHNGEISGAMELYYSVPRTFTDQDVHTCQLMAGLVTEALARDEEIAWKKSLATERAAMLKALEKLQPNLAALMEPNAKAAAPVVPAGEVNSYSCRKCGHRLIMDEQFCGHCGTPRASDYEAASMQSKLASMWQMQESSRKQFGTDSVKNPVANGIVPEPTGQAENRPLVPSLEEPVRELLVAPDDLPVEIGELQASATDSGATADPEDRDLQADNTDTYGEELKPSEALAVASTHSTHWSSAASARTFLEMLTPVKHRGNLHRLWMTHRGDIYLGIAVTLVVGILGWGIWSDHSAKSIATRTTSSAAHHKAPPEADLSFFERVLVQLGLAEPPPTPEDKGNPGVQVWVDLQTALYYCPGTDLYGKTSKGKFTTQHEAQLDQFEPAYRKACR